MSAAARLGLRLGKEALHPAFDAGRFPRHRNHGQQRFVRLERLDAGVGREFRVQYAVNGIGDGGGSANTTTSTATGLWPGYTYTITVTAYSLNGTTGALSTESGPVTVTTAKAATTPPPTAPTAPTDLNGWGDGGGEAIISWNPSTSVNEPQSQIQYNIYIDGVLDSFDSTVGDTSQVYIFPRGATVPAQVWVVAVDQFGNQSAPSNVLTITGF
jgi:hypothetical protein